MTKVCLTDFDETHATGIPAAKEMGILKDFTRYKNNPAELEMEDFKDLKWNNKKSFEFILNNYEIFDGSREFFYTLEENGYKNCISTRNMLLSLDFGQEIIRDKLSYNGIKPNLVFHVTEVLVPNGDGTYSVEKNGSKSEFASRMFKKADKGVHISDDWAELDTAQLVSDINGLNPYIINLKLGKKDSEHYSHLNDIIYADNINSIWKNKKLMAEICQ